MSAAADRRLHPRESASDPVKLVTRSGQVFDMVVVDRSLRGMRVQSHDVASLPSEVTVLAPRSGAVHEARVVWRTSPYAGLLLTRSVDMRSAAGSETAELRRLWREHITR